MHHLMTKGLQSGMRSKKSLQDMMHKLHKELFKIKGHSTYTFLQKLRPYRGEEYREQRLGALINGYICWKINHSDRMQHRKLRPRSGSLSKQLYHPLNSYPSKETLSEKHKWETPCWICWLLSRKDQKNYNASSSTPNARGDLKQVIKRRQNISLWPLRLPWWCVPSPPLGGTAFLLSLFGCAAWPPPLGGVAFLLSFQESQRRKVPENKNN